MKTDSRKSMQRLKLLMDLADKAFENYLPEKFYIHALCIKKNNNSIYSFIAENIADFPAELNPHFVSLLNHFDIWMTQFEHFEKTKVFSLNEPFVFFHLDNKSAYPKDAAASIRAYI